MHVLISIILTTVRVSAVPGLVGDLRRVEAGRTGNCPLIEPEHVQHTLLTASGSQCEHSLTDICVVDAELWQGGHPA